MLSRRPFRVALVGCGRIAHVHAGYLRAIPEAELVGACDASPEAREAFTRRWQIPTCASLREMFGALQPEVVHVVTPPHTHAPLAIELMRAGMHVMVEKPMAVSTREADRMLEVARETGRVLSVDHNRWFDPVMVQARQLLDSGDLGELVGVDVFCSLGEAEGESQAWKSTLPGGPVFDSAPHPVYLAYGLIGNVEQVQATGKRDSRGVIHELRAILQGDRAWATLTISSRARPLANTVTLFGSRSSAWVNLNHMTLVVRRQPQLPKLLAKVFPNLDEARQLLVATARNTIEFLAGKQRFYPGIGCHLRAFYGALAQGRSVPVSPEDGRAVVALVEELWRLTGGDRKVAEAAA